SLNLGLGFQRLRDLGTSIREVRLTGGAANNPLWRQILANVFGAPVRVLIETESAALGAALQACWSVRRLEHRDLTCDEVATPFVRVGATTEPNGDAGRYAELLQHYRREVARVYS
ncbi:MAG: xylulokinase, partial [Planctomycetota bacterium]